jgi:hypothetical protein
MQRKQECEQRNNLAPKEVNLSSKENVLKAHTDTNGIAILAMSRRLRKSLPCLGSDTLDDDGDER